MANGIQFPDPTSWFALINQRRQLQMEQERLQLARMQAEFDRANAEESLLMARATRQDRIRTIAANAALTEQRVKVAESEQRALDAFTAKMAGIRDAVGNNATMDHLANVTKNLQTVDEKVSGAIPKSMRSQFDGMAPDLGVITEAIESKLARGDLDAMVTVLGADMNTGTLAPYFKDEFYDRARILANRFSSAQRASLAAVPNAEWLSKNLAGSPMDLIQGAEAAIQANSERAKQFANPIYDLPELQAERDSAALQAAEKHRELTKLLGEYIAGQNVLVSGSGAITPEQQAGVRGILKGQITDLFNKMNPAATIPIIGASMRQANFIPSDIIAPVFESAARSGDSLAQLKASMLYDSLKNQFPAQQWDPLTKEIGKHGDLLDVLETMSQVRKSIGRAEAGIMAFDPSTGGEGQADQILRYAQEVATKTSSVLSLIPKQVEATQATAILEEESPPGEKEALLVSAAEKLSRGDGWFSSSVLGELGLNKEDAPGVPGMLEEFTTVANSYEQLIPETRDMIASNHILHNYHRGTLTDDDAVTRVHPIHVARSVFGREDMDADLAMGIAKWQASLELSEIKVENGEQARYRLEDLDSSPILLQDGGIGYDFFRKGTRNLVYRFRPDYSDEALMRVWDESRGVRLPGDENITSQYGLHAILNKYLGSESPRAKAKAAEEAKQRAERTEAKRKMKLGAREALRERSEMRRGTPIKPGPQ
jgi:hypothetical protein